MPEEGKEKISWLTDEKENKQHTTQFSREELHTANMELHTV